MPKHPSTRDHYFESEPLASTIARYDSKEDEYDNAPLRGDYDLVDREPVGDLRDELMDEGPDEPYCED